MKADTQKIPVAILGSGNIGTDLMYKVHRSPFLELRLVSGIDPESEGLARARELGADTSTDGVDGILDATEIKLVFDATSARTHLEHAPRLKDAGKIAIDLTPAKVGPSVVPCVNMDERYSEPNVNMISCGAQATVPIIHAIGQVAPISYAEIVATVASKSAGPGTRQNIDEFTRTTGAGLMEVGGAKAAKAIIVLNPADPPIIMRNTIYMVAENIDEVDEEEIRKAVHEMVENVRAYVPGYQITVEPYIDDGHIVVGVEVTGAGDYLPAYAGNLDIITAAATAVAEKYSHALAN